MREILFRGKRLQGGDWVEGYFFKSDINKRARESGKATLIFTPDCDTFITVPECHNSFMVVSDTVGQYTGLTDKNGKMIWEGDIMVAHLDESCPDNKTYQKVIWNESGFHSKEKGSEDISPIDRFDQEWFEVIGNIFDNPELLGSEE